VPLRGFAPLGSIAHIRALPRGTVHGDWCAPRPSQHLALRRLRVATAPSNKSQLSSRPRPRDASEQPPLSESESDPPEEEPPPEPEPEPTQIFTAFCAQLVSDDALVQSPQLTLLPLTS
jgi:hypothetical protein